MRNFITQRRQRETEEVYTGPTQKVQALRIYAYSAMCVEDGYREHSVKIVELSGVELSPYRVHVAGGSNE